MSEVTITLKYCTNCMDDMILLYSNGARYMWCQKCGKKYEIDYKGNKIDPSFRGVYCYYARGTPARHNFNSSTNS